MPKNSRKTLGTRMDAPPSAGRSMAAAVPRAVETTMNVNAQWTGAISTATPTSTVTKPISSKLMPPVPVAGTILSKGACGVFTPAAKPFA
ncbi:hypothetical protein D9M69_619300 [compost metagenome]